MGKYHVVLPVHTTPKPGILYIGKYLSFRLADHYNAGYPTGTKQLCFFTIYTYYYIFYFIFLILKRHDHTGKPRPMRPHAEYLPQRPQSCMSRNAIVVVGISGEVGKTRIN